MQRTQKPGSRTGSTASDQAHLNLWPGADACSPGSRTDGLACLDAPLGLDKAPWSSRSQGLV